MAAPAGARYASPPNMKSTHSMKTLFSIPALSFLFALTPLAAQEKPCCGDEATEKAEGGCCSSMQEAKPAAKLDAKVWDLFGEPLLEAPAIPVADALKKPEQFTGKTVRLTAPINSVCAKKGCWMGLGAVDASGKPEVFVKFKDYAFFVPKDAAGRTAIVEGTMTFEQETVEQTRHYLEDAGKHEEAAKVTEGRKLYKFLANGVAISKPVK
jgi:hypothetical protein